jgi:shikimate dehydrogenase
MRRLLAVLGTQVDRSLSPRLHAKAAETCGIDVAYVPVVCQGRGAFVRAVQALMTLNGLGANVTMPFKDDARDLSDVLSVAAEDIATVNTLVFRSDGSIFGDNTDGPALFRLFRSLPEEALARVQILGAGGAARAAVWALSRLDIRDFVVASRSPAGSWVMDRSGRVTDLTPHKGATLVISALPGEPALAARALSEWVDTAARPLIFDLAYGDLGKPSPMVADARRLGLSAVDGLPMLVEQAALALALWTDHDVLPIRRTMYEAVGLEEGMSGTLF